MILKSLIWKEITKKRTIVLLQRPLFFYLRLTLNRLNFNKLY